MNCYNCGAENAENAKFCKDCGVRLDGTVTCPSCGEAVPHDSTFCSFCGAKLKPEEAAQSQAAVPASQEVAVSAVAGAPVTAKADFSKILNYTAVGAAIITALISLIFVFFTGTVATGPATTEIFGGGIEKIDVFYYFGKVYKNLDKVFSQTSTSGYGVYYTDYYKTACYLPAVLGTVISAATLLSVFILSIAAIVRGVKYVNGKSENNGGGLAIGAFLSYIVGSALLLALNNFKVSVEESYRVMEIGVKFNGATSAGIALGACTAAVYFGCALLKRGKQLLSVDSLIKTAIAVVGIVLTIVVLSLCSRSTLGVEMDEMGYGEGLSASIMYFVSAMGVMCMTPSSYVKVRNADTVMAFAVISFILLIAVVCIAAYSLFNSIGGASGKERKGKLAVSAVLVVLALAFMIFVILTGNQFLDAVDYIENGASDEVSISYSIPIVVFVLSALNLAADVVKVVLAKKKV